MMSKFHHFFMLPKNSSPVIISVSAFNMLFSMLMMMKFNLMLNLIVSVANIFLGSFFWWVTFSSELNLKGKVSDILEGGVKMSMILFIYSEVFFFFSFFWSYFHFCLSPILELGLNWPPYKIISFDFMNVPLINTMILLSSGVTITVSHHYLLKGKEKSMKMWLFLTIMLGVMFTILQVMEYKSSFFSISDSTFGTAFFMLTGFHGLHVVIGTTYLATTLWRFFKMISSKNSCLSFELSSWYWHFVDVVWIFLYFIIYYMNS